MHVRRPAARAGGVHAGLPALRSLLQPGRHRAHHWRHAGHATSGCWNGTSSSERRIAQHAHGGAAACRSLSVDVDRARPGRDRHWLSCWRRRPPALAVAAPVLVLWFVAPAIAWWISRPLARRAGQPDGRADGLSAQLARKTWAFFETFVGAEDHWLPPDNFQEHPGAVVAHRTSPTNMGLALLANLSAYDFGYICRRRAARAHGQHARTMATLERHRGHFYNWYDTQTLQPLPPLYVSSVDSGNLAGHLLTLRPGLLALADQQILGTRAVRGPRRHAAGAHAKPRQAQPASAGPADPAAARHRVSLRSPACHALPPRASWLTRWPARRRQSPPASSTAHRATAGDANATGGRRPWPAMPGRARRTDIARAVAAIAAAPGTARRAAGIRCNPDAARTGDSTRSGCRRSSCGSLAPATTPAERALDAHWSTLAQPARRSERIAVHRTPGPAGRRAGAHGLRLPVRQGAPPAGHRLQRRSSAGGTPGYYDLLASEARLASFVAIAQGQLPQESWFALGRLLTSSRRRADRCCPGAARCSST